MTAELRDELIACASRLPEPRLRALISALKAALMSESESARYWSTVAGSISHEDAEQMRQAVEDCERVEPDGW